MPEEIEIDTDRLREAIDDAVERDVSRGESLLRRVSLTTACFAALAAVAALQAGGTVNAALLAATESGTLQARASDEWAYYQAKGIRAAVARGAAESWAAAGRTPPPALLAEAGRERAEQDSLRRRATAFERARDARASDAERLQRRHEGFAVAVALLQVGIALGAVAALTRRPAVWAGSLALGAAGAALFLWRIAT